MTATRIPLTVVGGYLGAGKTTLLNRLLTGDHGRRIAVVVNDFGDVAIDEALIESDDGTMRALANGCVCCSAVDGLAVALDELANLEPRPEHLVIEVSGVGDPWAVAQWGRTPGYELEGVVVVVDPESVDGWLDDPLVGDTVATQITGADIVLVSRTDVTDPATVTRARDRIGIITDAPVFDAAAVGVEILLPLDRVGRGGADSHALHVARSFVPQPTDRAGLDAWLAAAPDGIVRLKGFVDVDGERHVVQRSGRRTEVTRQRPPSTGEPAMTAVAVPGTDPEVLASWTERISRRAR
ncbi:MAG: GTP-binding protein [Acidimicrobiales bacterium]|nr:GTP-binding protein [Acidimicrobiales bacterium]